MTRFSPSDVTTGSAFEANKNAADLLSQALQKETAGEGIDRAMACGLVEAVLAGRLEPDRFGIWLEQSAVASPSAALIAGVADALRHHMSPLPFRGRGFWASPHAVVADTCGTGGDHSGSFNISTAAAIVVAAAGLPVAKHGNRAVSSRTGSADVLEALGVRIEISADATAECLGEIGLCFCYAPLYHPALATLGPLRRRLGKPTVFNLVGPLCNPAGASVQVIGVGRHDAQDSLAEAAMLLGLSRALIVACEDGVDEIGLFAPTRVVDVSAAGLRRVVWSPEDVGIPPALTSQRDQLSAANPAESAALIRRVLAGERGPCRDIVVLNAAALLWAAEKAATLPEAAAQAAAAIDSGLAQKSLECLVAATHTPRRPPT